MSNDAFEAESQVLEQAEALLQDNPNEQDLYQLHKYILQI